MTALDHAECIRAIVAELQTTTARLRDLAAELERPPSPRLDVPYLSQWGEGADERRGDCGPACVAMLARYLTVYEATVDYAARVCGQPTTGEASGYTSHKQLRDGASAFGITLQTRSPYTEAHGLAKLNLALLKAKVAAGLPSIALIHYGVLRDATDGTPYVANQDRTYARGHWVLFVGYDDAGSTVTIHDPDYWGDRVNAGAFRLIPSLAFIAALKTVAPGCTVGWQGLVVK